MATERHSAFHLRGPLVGPAGSTKKPVVPHVLFARVYPSISARVFEKHGGDLSLDPEYDSLIEGARATALEQAKGD